MSWCMVILKELRNNGVGKSKRHQLIKLFADSDQRGSFKSFLGVISSFLTSSFVGVYIKADQDSSVASILCFSSSDTRRSVITQISIFWLIKGYITLMYSGPSLKVSDLPLLLKKEKKRANRLNSKTACPTLFLPAKHKTETVQLVMVQAILCLFV